MIKTQQFNFDLINNIKKLKGMRKHRSIEYSEISFASYTQSMKVLTQTMSNNEKQKLSKFFVPINLQKAEKIHQKGSSSLIKSFGSSSHMSKQISLLKSREDIFNQHFVSEIFNNSSKSNLASNSISPNLIHDDKEDNYDDFTHEEKESLKNAFRYICRLIFKQANKYSQKMNLLEQLQPKAQKVSEKQNIKKSRSMCRSSMSVQKAPLLEINLAGQAELISGERYFKQFLHKLSPKHKPTLLRYMIWFLKTKYLRYINKCNNENKGKRKQMKKQLYIRFKNTTMLPYLQALLIQEQSKHQN